MCFLSGGCVLIAEVVAMVGWWGLKVQPTPLYKHLTVRNRAAGHTGSDIKGNQTLLHLHKGNLYFFFFCTVLGFLMKILERP